MSTPLYNGPINKPRGKPTLLVIEMGKKSKDETLDELFAVDNLYTDIWHVNIDDLSQQPTTKRLSRSFAYESMSVVIYGNFLFLFGVENTSFSPVSLRFDGTTNSWINLEPIPDQAAIGSAVVRIENTIIVAGGMYVDKDSKYQFNSKKFTQKVHKYHIGSNSWTNVIDLPEKLAFAGACEFNGMMHVAGGEICSAESLFGYEESDKAWAYDLKANIWISKPHLPDPWYDLSLASFKNKLYAFGGTEPTVATFTENDNEWKSRENFELKRGVACYFIHDDTLFIIGGDTDEEGDENDESGQLFTCHPDGYLKKFDKQFFRKSFHTKACAILSLK